MGEKILEPGPYLAGPPTLKRKNYEACYVGPELYVKQQSTTWIALPFPFSLCHLCYVMSPKFK